MYLDAGLVLRLILLPLFHFLSIFFLWNKIGIYVFFISWIPMVVNIILFSSPFLNYLATLMFSICTLMYMKVPVEGFVYDNLFVGMQAITLCLGMFVSVVQNKILPQNSSKQQKYIDRLMKYKDNIVVEYDLRSQSIKNISNIACSLYRYKKRRILGKHLTTIHLNNFLLNPPIGFWEDLKSKNIWHGYTDVITNDRTVCEERAYFKALKNMRGNIVGIEKKVLEILIKTSSSNQKFQYNLFFENFPMPMAVINKNHGIEKSNSCFIKEIQSKGPFIKGKFIDLFLGFQKKQQIKDALTAAFKGEKSSFISKGAGIGSDRYAEYIFIPHLDPIYKESSYVLFLLRKTNSEVALDQSIKSHTSSTEMEVLNILRQSLTDIYSRIPNIKMKVFGNSLPIIKGSGEVWKKLCDSILIFALKESQSLENITTISCHTLKNRHFFKVSFSNIFYQDLTEIEHKTTTQILTKILSLISSDMSFLKGKAEELILSFSIQE